MSKKNLNKYFMDKGFKTSYSGKTKTLFLHSYMPGTIIEKPEGADGFNVVGLQEHKLF